MKLLICTPEYYPESIGGIATSTRHAVEQFRNYGVECTVCSPTGPDIKLGYDLLIKKFGFLGLLYYWQRVKIYYRKNMDKYDATWLVQPLILGSLSFVNCLVTFKVCLSWYNEIVKSSTASFFHKVYYMIRGRLERIFLERLDKTKVRVTNVNPTMIGLLRRFGLRNKEIKYIPNGVDTNKFKPRPNKEALREYFGLPKDHIVLIWVGKSITVKQPKKMIEVFSILRKKIEKVTLIMVGDEKLPEILNDLGEEPRNLFFTGLVSQEVLAKLYASSDCIINSSISEGQPLTILEALASELPPIVSNIPQLRDLINEAGCGVIVDFKDTNVAVEKIVNYLMSGKLLSDAKKARKFVVTRLDWKVIAKKYLVEIQRSIDRDIRIILNDCS